MNRLILCMLFFVAEAVMGRSVSESGYSNNNGVIRVAVFMDLIKEKNIKFPEGTAMLRANRLLHKACPELPDKYNVVGRVLTNSYNRVENIYSYVVEYDPQSINAVLKQVAIDAEKARETEHLAAEKNTRKKSKQEMNTVGGMGIGGVETNVTQMAVTKDSSSVISNFAHSVKRDVIATNDFSVVQQSTTNIQIQSVEVSVCERNASVTNAPIVKAETKTEKVASPPVQLKDLTVKDIKEKMVRPKVTEKNGFKQIDIDSFGGIDPLEE